MQASTGFVTLVNVLRYEWETGNWNDLLSYKTSRIFMAWVHLYEETHIFELHFVNQLSEALRLFLKGLWDTM